MLKRSTSLVGIGVMFALLIALIGGIAQATPGTTGLGFDDAYTQIVNHEVPIQPDGKPTYVSWGRYYTGPNGLEIRLNSAGTWNTLQTVALADGSVVTDGISEMGAVMQTIVKMPAVKVAAIGASGYSGTWGNDEIRKIILGNLCLGITVPSDGLNAAFIRAEQLLRGDVVQAFQPPQPDDIKVWFEHCATGDPKPNMDNVTAPALPAAQPTDTQPAVPAQATTTTAPKSPQSAPQPAKGVTAPPPPPSVAPAPPQVQTDYNVDMNKACQATYNDAQASSHYQNFNDPDSWVCLDSAGNTIGGLSIQGWCDTNPPGSKAVNVTNDAYGWRCRL